MSKWIRDNLVLVSGIALPVLLVIGFFILNSIPRVLAEPPEYDFLLVGYQYNYQDPFPYYLSFEVRDGKLGGQAIPAGTDNTRANRQNAVLFLYHVDEQRYEQIPFDLPTGIENLAEPVDLELGKAGELKLDKRIKSPDGYQFEFQGYRGRGGLLGEIFGMNRRYESNYVLVKDGNYINLADPSTDPYYYQNDLQFIGWVIPGPTAP